MIFGMGTAGSRHARILRELIPQIFLVAVRRPGQPPADLADVTVHGLAEALPFSPDVAVLAGPAHTHVAQLWDLVQVGVATLVEKPLSHELDGVEEVLAAAREREVCVAVGYNLRCSPLLLEARDLSRSGAIGNLLSLRADVGQELSTWRVGQNPRDSVSVRESTGGGALLELSHELDLALWIAGPVGHVTAETRRVGAYTEDVEDIAEVLISHESGAISSVHVDLLARPARRRLAITGEEGTIECDILTGSLRVGGNEGWEERQFEAGVGATYQRQMQAFVHAVRTGSAVPADLSAGRDALALAISARRSAETGRKEVATGDGRHPVEGRTL